MVEYVYTRNIDCGGHIKTNAIPYCSECKKVIDRTWDYCPFCGDRLTVEYTNQEPCDIDGKEDEDGREE